MRQHPDAYLTYPDTGRDPRLLGVARGLHALLDPLVEEPLPKEWTELAAQAGERSSDRESMRLPGKGSFTDA
jgi:hypothetical protein